MSECSQCGGKLGVKATRCRCGWVMPGAARADYVPEKIISCCFANCLEGARCRVYTKTGWANVCLTHYQKIDRVPQPRTMTPFAVACQQAWQNSYEYRKRHGLQRSAPSDRAAIEAELEGVRKRMEASMPAREPGQDDDLPLGIGRDPLEAEFMDRAQP